MMCKTTLVILILALLTPLSAQDLNIPWYYSQYDFLMGAPGTYNDGMLGFANPANLAFVDDFESRFYWSTDGTNAGSFNNWGLMMGGRDFGLGVLRKNHGYYKSTDYRLTFAGGTESFGIGFGYGWSSVTNDSIPRDRIAKIGFIARPNRYLSIGITGDFSFETSAQQGLGEIGIRPFGTSVLTLFADIAMQKKTMFKDAPWSAGGIVELARGINFSGRYFDSDMFTAGFTFEFGRDAISGQSHYDSDQKHSYNSYMLRGGARRASIFPDKFDKDRRFLKLNLKGRVAYNKYRFFDDSANRFYDILTDIKAAVDDPRVGAIAINLSSASMAPELAWEIREELLKAKDKGLTVIVFIDDVRMTTYHLASVADKVVIDPQGIMILSGYSLDRTFFRGTLEKLGLTFDEWRYFEYKSAAEILSRDEMSEADKRQRQDYTDDLYESVRADICRSRNLSIEQYDSIIDDQMILLPETALELGLVDTLARWSDVNKIVAKVADRNMRSIPPKDLYANSLSRDEWGAYPEIAVVYGLGECALDSGIRARWLEKVFLSLADAKSIKAVVFRVDSPGGDGMASDLVSDALKKCAEKKPVIISQGQVAGSGGYWISMYGDKILAGPTTLTGSIGVIGGWLYDSGMSEKLGMTHDFVKRGEHADVIKGFSLPGLGISVPARNLTDDEKEKVAELFQDFYTIFVKKVAEGRGMTEEEVRKIGEGHFYSGLDGKEIDLVDEIGGLMLAIEIAKSDAGIDPDEYVGIREIPRYKGIFNIDPPVPFMSAKIAEEPEFKYIRMINDFRGKPLPMLIPGTYPEIEQ